MKRGVIFDVDGTLVDTVDLHARAWTEAFAHFGHDVNYADVRAQIGKGADQLMPVFLSHEEAAWRGEEIDRWRHELYRREYMPRARAFRGVKELFQTLRADGKRIALASSAKEEDLPVYAHVAGIDGLYDAATSADDAKRSKPCPDIFEAALAALGMTPEEAAVVGDSPHDVTAAARAGLPTIGLLCGGFPEESLRAAGVVEIYADPEDLRRNYRNTCIARP